MNRVQVVIGKQLRRIVGTSSVMIIGEIVRLVRNVKLKLKTAR